MLASRGGGFGAGTPREGWDHAEPWLPHALAATGLEPGFITAELTLAEVNPAMADVRPDRGCDEECRQEEKHAESKGDSGMTDSSTSARPNAVRIPSSSARLNASANSLVLPKPARPSMTTTAPWPPSASNKAASIAAVSLPYREADQQLPADDVALAVGQSRPEFDEAPIMDFVPLFVERGRQSTSPSVGVADRESAVRQDPTVHLSLIGDTSTPVSSVG